MGIEGYHLAADGNGDGKVDTSDFNIWQENFGETWSAEGSGASKNVLMSAPESASLSLAVLSTFALLSARRQFARRVSLRSPCLVGLSRLNLEISVDRDSTRSLAFRDDSRSVRSSAPCSR
jgi:hypothetical protein